MAEDRVLRRWFVKEYWEKDCTIARIAELLNVSVSTVARAQKRRLTDVFAPGETHR